MGISLIPKYNQFASNTVHHKVLGNIKHHYKIQVNLQHCILETMVNINKYNETLKSMGRQLLMKMMCPSNLVTPALFAVDTKEWGGDGIVLTFPKSYEDVSKDAPYTPTMLYHTYGEETFCWMSADRIKDAKETVWQCLLPPQGILRSTTPSQFLHRYRTSRQVGLHHPNGLGHNCPCKMAEPITVRELIATWEDNWPLLCGSNFCHVALVVEAIMTGTAITVSDGSYMPKMCTQLAKASWCIENPLTTLACHGLAQVSGTKAETNAYQAELQGIHTILMALKVICDFHLIQHGSITIHCDNEKGIYLSSHTWLQPSIHIKHVDLIRAIRKLATSPNQSYVRPHLWSPRQ